MPDEQRPFRFGVNMIAPGSRAEWVAKCRRAESLGYDVVAAADHLGMAPVFPALVLAAEATERVRLSSFVLNTGFRNPTLLAREVAGADQFTGGRLELGLGAGYVKDEFDAAGIPWQGAGKRVDHLERTLAELRRRFADPEHLPSPAQRSGPPILLAGRGDRMLRLAAEHADIVGFNGAAPGGDGAFPALADAAGVAERVAFARAQLGGRDAELNILVLGVRVTGDRRAAAAELASQVDLSAEQVLEAPSMLLGTHAQIAEQLVQRRQAFGFSYVTVLEEVLDDFAPVIELLR